MQSRSTSTSDTDALWTIRQVAEQVGLSVSHLTRLRRAGTLPEPIGLAGRALLWNPDDVQAWHESRSAPPRLWSLQQAGDSLGVSADWLRKQRRLGRLPEPAENLTPGGRRPRWEPAVLRTWLKNQRKPAAALNRAQVLTLIDRASAPASSPLPQPDGRIGTRAWWYPATIRVWWADHQVKTNRLWSRTTIENQLSRTWDQLKTLATWEQFPKPAARRPEHLWEPDGVRAWWRHHRARAARHRWDTQEVARNTGLSWDTVRTYRRKNILPQPDGMDGTHPWWLPATIRVWDRKRRNSGTGRPRKPWRPTTHGRGVQDAKPRTS